jgi:RNA polymerase sigma-70 factor (ECF subfamily)
MSLQTTNGLASKELPSNANYQDFERELVALIPFLRGLAGLLCGRRAIAEDMAQEALTRAWRSRDSFEPGTNIRAWLFTILRNAVYSHGRRAWRELQWDETLGEKIPAPAREQEWVLEISDTARALSRLKLSQREALILVSVCGFSQSNAAKICGVPTGTIKSRATRARAKLLSMLDGDASMPPRGRKRSGRGADDILAQLSDRTRDRVRLAARGESRESRNSSPAEYAGKCAQLQDEGNERALEPINQREFR